MAISVGRGHSDVVRVDRLERYGARCAAVAGYAAAVVLAFVLLAPVLFRGDPAPAGRASAPPPAKTDVVWQGDTLDVIAARNGISVARLLVLNPSLGPFDLELRPRVRVG